METGENKAWEILAAAEPAAVCKNAAVSYDAAGYGLTSFNAGITVSLTDNTFISKDPAGELLLGRLGYFSRLSILWYLTCSKDLGLTGKHISPGNLKGGQLFFRGSHVLPLDKLAEKYTDDPEGFIRRGLELGGTQTQHGDAAITLFPLPRIPVTLILWRGDDEFPPRADLLFDSSCEAQLALDILWSIAMMTVLIMMM